MLPIVAMSVVTFVTLVIAYKTRKPIVAFWFLWSGAVHIVLEASWGMSHHLCTEKSPGMFMEEIFKDKADYPVWSPYYWGTMEGRIYGHYDNRYINAASHDLSAFIIFVVWVELFFMGPACFAVVYAMQKRLPWRHPLQLVVSLVQLYGTLVYYFEPIISGKEDEIFIKDPLSRWIFVWILNGIWVVVPAFLIIRSFYWLTYAMKKADPDFFGEKKKHKTK